MPATATTPEVTVPPGSITVPPGSILALLPAPTDNATARALRETLRGHATADSWLPEDVPELAEIRAQHLRLRALVAGCALAIRTDRLKWRREDQEHARALQEAARMGTQAPDDSRTSAGDRQAAEEAALERLWPAVGALAEVVDEAVALIRKHEDVLLARLRDDHAAAHEKRRAAERLIREADTAAWHAAQRGQWLQATADDGPFGKQSAPVATPPPPRVTAAVVKNGLTRPWQRRQPWNAGA